MYLFSYRTASVNTSCLHGVGLARVSGVVTSDALRLIIADSTQWAGGSQQLAHIVHYSEAAMALTLDQMVCSGRAAKRADAINATPSALIVSAAQMPLFDAYAAVMQRLGFSLGVFTGAEDGQRWAARQALVREHWLGLRAGLQRSAP